MATFLEIESRLVAVIAGEGMVDLQAQSLSLGSFEHSGADDGNEWTAGWTCSLLLSFTQKNGQMLNFVCFNIIKKWRGIADSLDFQKPGFWI